MTTARNAKEIKEFLVNQYAEKIKKAFEDGEKKKYCTVCECEQVLKLDGIKAKCTVCDKEFDLDIKVI